jgi:hypothetical protein
MTSEKNIKHHFRPSHMQRKKLDSAKSKEKLWMFYEIRTENVIKKEEPYLILKRHISYVNMEYNVKELKKAIFSESHGE